MTTRINGAIIFCIFATILVASIGLCLPSTAHAMSAVQKRSFDALADTVDDSVWDKAIEAQAPRIAVVQIGDGETEPVVSWLEEQGAKDDLYVDKPADPSQYDGLALPGGADIDPEIYGQEKAPETYGINTEGDHLQIDQVLAFAQQGKPVLGVCRGCQVITVAYGGTMIQHIEGRHYGYRGVNIGVDSWLYNAYNRESVDAWHSHHQCADDLGEGLIATQWDETDGHIEGVEHETLPVYGIQWHPEGKMGEPGKVVARQFMKICLLYRLGGAYETLSAYVGQAAA